MTKTKVKGGGEAAAIAAAPAIPEYVLVLRTCGPDMKAHGGFTWPESGLVECPDWDPKAECGNGLHGLLWGEGKGDMLKLPLHHGADAKTWDDLRWLVVKVEAALIVDLEGKVKFPRGEVIFCGDRASATAFILENGGNGRAVTGAAVSAGDAGTATAGDAGTATAGNRGTATAGDDGTATAGNRGTATAGDAGTATAGARGSICIKSWDGKRYRLKVGDIGDHGLEPYQPYRFDKDADKFVEAGPNLHKVEVDRLLDWAEQHDAEWAYPRPSREDSQAAFWRKIDDLGRLDLARAVKNMSVEDCDRRATKAGEEGAAVDAYNLYAIARYVARVREQEAAKAQEAAAQ